MSYLYAWSVVLSAFLLFQIQPMIGKFILPWFGGTPAVWSTVLLFFQALLTGGYAYAYGSLGRWRNRRQGIIHLVLLVLTLGLLLAHALAWKSPLLPDASWRPLGSDLPVWGIVKVLAVAVGIPYLLLASNSTLMQAWFAQDRPGKVPYRLYALSNTGSLLALISYPILVEPTLSLRAQAYLWSAGYGIFAIVAGFLALRASRRAPADPAPESRGNPSAEGIRPGVAEHLVWAGLAACASALLISVTNQITQDVAVIPFLWILPLTLYLLTFILAFSGGRLYSRGLYVILFFLLSFASIWMLANWARFPIASQIVVLSLLLFVCCMLCHNEMFKLRPHPRFLPSFYLMVALGGAAGGVSVTLLAPRVFSTGFWELQWGLVACGALLAVVMQRGKRHEGRRKGRGHRGLKPSVAASAIGLLLMGAFVLWVMASLSPHRVWAARSFFGVLRVWEINSDQPDLRAHLLSHGRTAHGFQFQAGGRRELPTTYYTEKSGVGVAIANHPARPGSLRIGVLGLGVGIIASYGKPGDIIRFYEINPAVIRIAEGAGGYFSYLSDSKAEVQVVPGDARVSLERELASQSFDLMVLDAFASDAVPLHLLTREAFLLYLAHLKQDGIMAVNVSNRHLNLGLEIFRLADELNLEPALIVDRGDGVRSYDSVWMLLTRRSDFLRLPAIAERSASRPPIPEKVAAWTDDYSDLLQILR